MGRLRLITLQHSGLKGNSSTANILAQRAVQLVATNRKSLVLTAGKYTTTILYVAAVTVTVQDLIGSLISLLFNANGTS